MLAESLAFWRTANGTAKCFARRRIVRIQASDAVCSGIWRAVSRTVSRTVQIDPVLLNWGEVYKYTRTSTAQAAAAAPALVARNDSVCMHADDAA